MGVDWGARADSSVVLAGLHDLGPPPVSGSLGRRGAVGRKPDPGAAVVCSKLFAGL